MNNSERVVFPATVSTSASVNNPGPRDNRPPNHVAIASWNCNGLVSRVNHGDWTAFGNYLVSLDFPDIVCIQEVRMCAAAPPDAIRYDHNKRNRGRVKCSDARSLAERLRVYSELNAFPFNNYNRIWSLADWRYSGQLVLVKAGVEIHGVRFNLDWNAPGDLHQHDGRVILLELDHFLLLMTYSCNQGVHITSMERRREWDLEVLNFVKHTQLVYSSGHSPGHDTLPKKEQSSNICTLFSSTSKNNVSVDADDAKEVKDSLHSQCSAMDVGDRIPILDNCPTKPLIWIGDLNCAPEDCDLTDPVWFRTKNFAPPGSLQLPPEYFGHPGCTDAERSAFRNILAAGHLIDAYRVLYPAPAELEWLDPAGPYFTWRGAPGVIHPSTGRFYGKGMRIDTAVIHESLIPRLLQFTIAGYGFFRSRFFGSDHTPITLYLSKDTTCSEKLDSCTTSESRDRKSVV